MLKEVTITMNFLASKHEKWSVMSELSVSV